MSLPDSSEGLIMTVTDEYLANNADYVAQFSGPLPLPPSKHVESSPFVTATTSLRGFIFDVATGKLDEVPN
jgi:hypothetical protein